MQPRWKKALPGALALLLFGALLARTTAALARAPALNWDMLPAMALALEWREPDPLRVHARTYAAARAELAPADFAALTAPGVRRERAQDPAAFHEHLGFYRARVLYSLAVLGLHGLGLPLTTATYAVPLACFVLTALVLLAWAARHMALPLAALFALGASHAPALLNQARLSSADGLATLLVALAGWALVEGRRPWVPALCALLAVAARPDAILLLGIGALVVVAWKPADARAHARPLLTWLALALALYLALERFARGYGWWPLIQISFVEKAVHPGALPSTPDWSAYGAILARQIAAIPGDGYTTTPAGEVTGSSSILLYGSLAGLGLALALRRRQARAGILLATLLLTYLLRFLLFPQLWDRLCAPFYVLVPAGLLALVCRELGTRAEPAAQRSPP